MSTSPAGGTGNRHVPPVAPDRDLGSAETPEEDAAQARTAPQGRRMIIGAAPPK
jgi:hypothetical protein